MTAFGLALEKIVATVPEIHMVMVTGADAIPVERLVVRPVAHVEAVAAEYTTLLRPSDRSMGRLLGAAKAGSTSPFPEFADSVRSLTSLMCVRMTSINTSERPIPSGYSSTILTAASWWSREQSTCARRRSASAPKLGPASNPDPKWMAGFAR